jgi:hypothetical protein
MNLLGVKYEGGRKGTWIFHFMYSFSTVVHLYKGAKGLFSPLNEVNLQGLKQYAVSFVQHCVGIEWNYIRKSVCRPRGGTCPEFN